MPGTQCKKTPGKHRKPSSRSIPWRTTGGVIAGAAVIGTVAATAQASVLPFHFAPGNVTAASPSTGKDKGESPADDKDKDKSENGGKNGERAEKGKPKSGSSKKRSGKSRPTAAEAIKVARSQVGIKEGRGGKTKFSKWYVRSPRAKKTAARDGGGSVRAYAAAPWCDMFISWIGEQIGFSDQIGSDAWTIAHAKWFRKHDRWGTKPRPGAIVFYAWNGGTSVNSIQHVGMVIKKIDRRTIKTVEGNADNAVRIMKRPTGSVVGYGYPRYRS